MFRAKLISDPNYYSYKKKLVAYSQLAIIFVLILYIILRFVAHVKEAWGISFFVVYAFSFYFTIKYNKKIKKAIDKKIIEIYGTQIEIKDNHGNLLESFNVKDADKIIVKNEYKMPEEGFKDIINTIKGKFVKNYIIFEFNGKQKKYDFLFDSYYMIEKLKELIKEWEAAGYNVIKTE